MGRLVEAVAAEKAKVGPKCGVGLLLARLKKADQEDLRGLLADTAVTGAALERAIKRVFGEMLQAQTILRHRRGGCGCAQ